MNTCIMQNVFGLLKSFLILKNLRLALISSDQFRLAEYRNMLLVNIHENLILEEISQHLI